MIRGSIGKSDAIMSFAILSPPACFGTARIINRNGSAIKFQGDYRAWHCATIKSKFPKGSKPNCHNNMSKYAKWLIVIGVVIALGTGGWLYLVYQQVQGAAIDEQAASVAQVVNAHIAGVKGSDFTSGDPKHIAAVFSAVWNSVQSPEYVRMKVWTPDYTVIWSNLPELIGQKFAPFDEVTDAVADKTQKADLESQKAENVGERQYDVLLETYVPFIEASGTVPGLIELYKVPTELDQETMTNFEHALPLPIGTGVIVFGLFAFGLHLFLKKKETPAAA